MRFADRFRGHQLDAGTYKISARTARGRLVRRVIIVIVAGSAPTKAELAAARSSNACSGSRGFLSTPSTPGSFTGASNTAAVSETAKLERVHPSAAGVPDAANTRSGAVLASTVEQTARAIRPALVALLAAAIVLLGLASLPSVAVAGPRVGELLARHRLEIAGIGAAAFIGVVIAFLLA